MDAITFQRAAGIPADRAAALAPHVTAAFAEWRITAPLHQAAWIAQCGHETLRFTRFREIWGPTAAQRGYEGRKDLGNTQPGDGKRFLGRGMIQITGRDGYTAASSQLGVDLIAHPEMLEELDLAASSAGWWWTAHKCGLLLDSQGFDAVTRRINGGYNGRVERQQLFTLACGALGL